MITYNKPTGRAADTSLSRAERARSYDNNSAVRLLDGTLIKPTADTVSAILDAHDLVPGGIEVAVTDGSFVIVGES
jgi:hypothetical protein